jgi:hypothetical protein
MLKVRAAECQDAGKRGERVYDEMAQPRANVNQPSRHGAGECPLALEGKAC